MHKVAKKNKRQVAVLSSAAIGVLIAAAVSSNAQAAVKSYVVQNGDKYTSFGAQTLLDDYTNKLLGDASPAYDAYLSELATEPGLIAFQDDVKGYVSAEAVENAYSNALATGDSAFDVDSFTENASEGDILSNVNIGYEWKDGAIVPVQSPVTVKSVDNITKTDVTVVLADKPAVDPTTNDFTLKVNGKSVTPTSVTKVASDLTGKTYKLAIDSLANTEGKLTVNGVEKAFDFKAPEVVSVSAKGTKTIEVTFNESIKDNTAIAGNFKVVKVSDPSDSITTGTVALSSDGTKATIALNKDLTVADYILKLGNTVPETATNRIKDVAGNSIYGGTEISFRPTSDQLAVKEAPSVTTVSYNNGTGTATVTFNKDITASNVDATKLTLGGVALTTSDAVAQENTNSITITLSADTKEAVNAVTGSLDFVGSEGAWTDGTTATAGQTVTVSKVTPAVVSSASYNQETKVLTINFDQAVTINLLDSIHVDDAIDGSAAVATGATNSDGTALDTTKASATWNLKLADTEAAKLENAANDKAKLKVYLDANAVSNDSTTVISNVATTYENGGVAVAYTADTTKPYVTSAEYDNNTNKLTIKFNEALNATSATNVQASGAVNIATAATGAGNTFDLSTETASLDTTKKVLTIDLTSANQGNLNAEYLTGKAIKVFFAKDVLVDENGLKNDATTFDTGIALTYHDFTAPKLDTTAGATETLNQTYVKAVFNEPVDKTTAETASNYVIKDLAGNTLAVNSAVLQSDKKTVYLNTAAQESGKPYSLTVNNVRDLQQNLIDTTANSITFYGSSTESTGKLGVDSTLEATAPVNSKNDTLGVTFDAPVNQTQALDLSNYSVLEASTDDEAGWADAKAVPLTDATAKIDTTGTKVTITLGSYNLQKGKYYKVVVGNVTDAYGNALDSTKTTAKSVALDAENLTTPSIKEANTKAGAVVLTFDQELNATEAAKVANYKVGTNAPTKATYAWDAEKGKATVTLDVATALTDPIDVQIKDTVTNLAGETIDGATYTTDFTTIPEPATLADSVAPTVDTVVAKAVSGSANDVITVNFKDSDILGDSVTPDDIAVKDAQGNVIPASDYTVAFVDGTPDTITVTLNKTGDNAYNLQNGENYAVTITGVVDTSGNALADTTKTVAWAADTDKDAPTIAPSGLAVTPGAAGTGKVVVTFNEDVDATTAANKANYAVKTSVDGTDWDTTLTPTFVTYDASSKKATIYFAETLTASASDNQYQVTVTGVKDLAGNVQTDGNSQVVHE